jgi:sugar O-acyltransferase (sialic acid O-acetyltransferase NeuD family)
VSAPSPPSKTGSIILIGAGGHAGVVAASARRGGLTVSAVLDADPDRVGQTFAGLTVEADTGSVDGIFHAAIGHNGVRRRVVEARADARWATVIDPSATLAEDVAIGDGVLIGMGARVQTGVRIGAHVIVNTGAIIDHDSVLGDFVHVAPGAVLTGGVVVGQGVLIGAGAVVLPGLSIGDGAVVGAGCLVTRSVAAGETVIGSPARPVRKDST